MQDNCDDTPGTAPEFSAPTDEDYRAATCPTCGAKGEVLWVKRVFTWHLAGDPRCPNCRRPKRRKAGRTSS